MANTTTSTPQQGGGSRTPAARPKAPAPAGGGDRSAPNIGNFFQESRAELRKVTWPTRQEATNLTVAVVGMTVAVAVFLGVIDAGLDKLVSYLLS